MILLLTLLMNLASTLSALVAISQPLWISSNGIELLNQVKVLIYFFMNDKVKLGFSWF